MSKQRTLFPNDTEASEGAAQVARHNEDFVHACCEYIRSLPREMTFTADRISWWADRNGYIPGHPNAFGAVFRAAKAAGLIEWTGETAKSTQRARKAGLIRIWRRT